MALFLFFHCLFLKTRRNKSYLKSSLTRLVCPKSTALNGHANVNRRFFTYFLGLLNLDITKKKQRKKIIIKKHSKSLLWPFSSQLSRIYYWIQWIYHRFLFNIETSKANRLVFVNQQIIDLVQLIYLAIASSKFNFFYDDTKSKIKHIYTK